MKPEEYGEKYPDHFLEQYKLYVEMADRVSQRREQSNRFYVTLLAALAALLVVVARFVLAEEGTEVAFLTGVVLICSVFGAALSVIWWVNIRSYRELNSAKFTIINRMEQQLPAAGYSDEWEILRPKAAPPKYFQLTRIEQFVPVVVGALFLGLAGYTAFLILS